MEEKCCHNPNPALEETFSETPEEIRGVGKCETCGQTIEAHYKLERVTIK